MSARQQPAQQTMMQHEQYTFPVRVEHGRGAGNVSRSKLTAREWIFRMRQQHERQLAALGGKIVARTIESLQHLDDLRLDSTQESGRRHRSNSNTQVAPPGICAPFAPP